MLARNERRRSNDVAEYRLKHGTEVGAGCSDVAQLAGMLHKCHSTPYSHLHVNLGKNARKDTATGLAAIIAPLLEN